MLVHFNLEQQLVLVYDGSLVGVGAVLSQRFDDGNERPIAYAPHSLSHAETNYSQIELPLA